MAKDENTLTPDEEAFADEMRRLREAAGWSQERLALEVQAHGPKYVNQSTISRIEKKARQVRLSEAQAIARAFDRSVESMLDPSELTRAADNALRYVRAATGRYENLKYHLEEFDEDYRTVALRLREVVTLADGVDHLPPLVGEAVAKCDAYLREAAPDLKDSWVVSKIQQAAETHA